jgi:hypothetical protein
LLSFGEDPRPKRANAYNVEEEEEEEDGVELEVEELLINIKETNIIVTQDNETSLNIYCINTNKIHIYLLN